MPGFGSVSPQQLARLIGTPDAPALFDVRKDEDFAADPRLLPGARRVAPDQAGLVAREIGGRPAVIVCQAGHRRSEGAAALLRAAGFRAEILEGGWAAAVGAGLPLVSQAVPLASGAPTLWVTRHRPKIDRVACPWLIRRFIDPNARFLFVSPGEVGAVAEQFGAIPFDIEGVRFSHRGDLCSFDAFLADFGLQTAPLDRLALVVRAADTDRHDLAPQAAGLLALSVGLSRQYRDDLEQLAAALPLYDALYRWARDAFDEGHDWPAGRQA